MTSIDLVVVLLGAALIAGLASLLPFRTTTVEFTPAEPGQYGFACGMNMLHGTLIVEPGPADTTDAPDGKDLQAREERAPDHAVEDTEATARAVGVGPRVNPHPGCERVQFTLPGSSRTLPTNAAKVEAQLRAIGGVDSAEVNVGAERVVLTYDPRLINGDGLASAVHDATGHDIADRDAPTLISLGTVDPRHREVEPLRRPVHAA